jgi:ferrous iron transport protein A
MNRSAKSPLTPLCQLPAGVTGLVRQIAGNAEFCQRVREMGFGESAAVKKVSGTGTILCQVNGTRLALSHAAARSILVERLERR